MPSEQLVSPNVGNFIESLRHTGYSFEVAVADIIDNSIAAEASRIKIHFAPKPTPVFSMLDNGSGMSEAELVEAMRLASKNPKDKRDKDDLGRFALGLKMASFSQCRKLTVLSKKDGEVSAKQWDLDYISERNEWMLLTPSSIEKLPLVGELYQSSRGTLVCWEEIDMVQMESFALIIDQLRKHLSLVFHRYLETAEGRPRLKLSINSNTVDAFDPFNSIHPATQQSALEKIKFNNEHILVQTYILPHHSKVSQQEYERYATEEGYLKSQGFYLYRLDRILTYGTWWGLQKATDAQKLVRIKVDIPSSMDIEWALDIKKSAARPPEAVRADLRRIASAAAEAGTRPYTGRGKRIEDKSVTQFWQLVPMNENIRFAVNMEHPLLKDVFDSIDDAAAAKLLFYLKGMQAFLPLEAIQSHLQRHPHAIKQDSALTEEDILNVSQKLKSAGLSDQYIQSLLKTEIFTNRKELLKDE